SGVASMSGTSNVTTPVNVRVDNEVKKRLDLLLERSGRTLTAVVRRYIDRLVAAWEATPGEPANEELILFLTAAQLNAAVHRAGSESKLAEAARRVLGAWASGGDVVDCPTVVEYPDLPKLVEAAQAALDRMLEVYTGLPVYDGDLAELFAAALQA